MYRHIGFIKNKKHEISVYLILFLIISCSPKIQYLGKTYPPTQNVDIFFNESDINRPFETIGMIRNSGKSYEKNNPEVIKTAMLAKAMQVGADAIIFHGMYKEKQEVKQQTPSETTMVMICLPYQIHLFILLKFTKAH